jgi:hypothetical protein
MIAPEAPPLEAPVSLAVWSLDGPAPQLVAYASTAVKRR